MRFDIEVSGVDEIAERLGAKLQEALEAAKVGVGKVAQNVQRDARKLSPRDSGENVAKIRMQEPEIKGNMIEAKVIAGARHAIYLELGTGPKGAASHEGISPDVNPTYRSTGWVYPTKDGGFRYTEGMPARPFMYPAYKANSKKAAGIVKEEIKKVVK